MVAALAALALPAPSSSQRTQSISGIDADVEGTVTSVMIALTPQVESISGEVYEKLSGWWRQTLAVTIGFKGGYALGLQAAVAPLDEQVAEGHARSTDFALELLLDRSVGPFRIVAGPVAGYGRVSRPAYDASTHGFIAGGRVGASRAIVGGLEVALEVGGLWSSFNRLPFATSPPAGSGFGDDAVGQKLTVGLGLAYRWSRGATP